MQINVAASNATLDEVKNADFRCDGIADNVEIQAANDFFSSNILGTQFQNEVWFKKAVTYITQRYRLIEDRMVDSFRYVTLDKENEKTFSYEFAGILRDLGSTFGWVMDILLCNTATKVKKNYDFGDYRKFLINEIPNIDSRSVTVNDLFPMVIKPFSALKDKQKGQPRWWRAYNRVKHADVSQHIDGNLANALGSLAGLAVLGVEMRCFIRTKLFVNVGITYPPRDPAVQKERILFDMN